MHIGVSIPLYMLYEVSIQIVKRFFVKESE